VGRDTIILSPRAGRTRVEAFDSTRMAGMFKNLTRAVGHELEKQAGAVLEHALDKLDISGGQEGGQRGADTEPAPQAVPLRSDCRWGKQR
jgi:hypothetical protein